MSPRTPVEDTIATIFSKILRDQRVGVEDDFFHLGGHSLLATQLVSRMRQTFDVEIPLRDDLSRPPLRALPPRWSGWFSPTQGERARHQPEARHVDADGAGPMPLSSRNSACGSSTNSTPADALQYPGSRSTTGELEPDAIEDALNAVVSRHESLRTTFGDVGGKAFQVIWPAMPLSVNRVDLSGEPPERRRSAALELARQEALRPFELAHSGPLTAQLLRFAEREHALLLTMHHIISDGWSVAVLVREFAQLYRQAVSKQSPQLLRRCPCSMPTMRCGSEPGSNARGKMSTQTRRRCNDSLTTGATNSQGCPLCLSCPRTGRGLPR